MVVKDLSYLFGGIFMILSFIYFCFLYYALKDSKEYHLKAYEPHTEVLDHIAKLK
jgi:hypothetical protein